MLDAVFKRWPLKLLALAIAFAIWIAITGESQIVKDLAIPLDLEPDKETILTGSRPTQVSVRLRGPESLIRRTDALDLTVQVELVGMEPGVHNVDLYPNDVSGVPPELTVELIDPNRIEINVSRRLNRLLPVVPAFVGQPAEGFAYYGSTVQPDTLEVTGPDAEVADLTRLRTTPIRLEGRSAPFTVSASAVPDSPEIRILSPRPLEISVVVDQAPVDRTIPDVPVILTGQVYETSVDPMTLEATLTGPPGLLQEITPDRLRYVVDISGLEPGREPHIVTPTLEFPDLPERDRSRIRQKAAATRLVTVRVAERRITE